MNTDQIKGKTKIVTGKVQETIGRVTGNSEQEIKGQNKQVAGHLQKGLGNIEKAIDDAANDLNQD